MYTELGAAHTAAWLNVCSKSMCTNCVYIFSNLCHICLKKKIRKNLGLTYFDHLHYRIITNCQVSSTEKFINRREPLFLITGGISPCSIQASLTWRGANIGMSVLSKVFLLGEEQQQWDFAVFREESGIIPTGELPAQPLPVWVGRK